MTRSDQGGAFEALLVHHPTGPPRPSPPLRLPRMPRFFPTTSYEAPSVWQAFVQRARKLFTLYPARAFDAAMALRQARRRCRPQVGVAAGRTLATAPSWAS